jgi:hypothetical protein
MKRNPSTSSAKRKAPHTNKGSRLLSQAENEGIYEILGKGRQVIQILLSFVEMTSIFVFQTVWDRGVLV